MHMLRIANISAADIGLDGMPRARSRLDVSKPT